MQNIARVTLHTNDFLLFSLYEFILSYNLNYVFLYHGQFRPPWRRHTRHQKTGKLSNLQYFLNFSMQVCFWELHTYQRKEHGDSIQQKEVCTAFKI